MHHLLLLHPSLLEITALKLFFSDPPSERALIANFDSQVSSMQAVLPLDVSNLSVLHCDLIGAQYHVAIPKHDQSMLISSFHPAVRLFWVDKTSLGVKVCENQWEGWHLQMMGLIH